MTMLHFLLVESKFEMDDLLITGILFFAIYVIAVSFKNNKGNHGGSCFISLIMIFIAGVVALILAI